MAEDRLRSIVKSILWRVMGIIILALITYFFTGSWMTAALITFFHHFAFIFIYYFHERLWLKIKMQGKRRFILKAFTYEIILGHIVLGIISFIFTGSWLKVTLITIVYIENKFWIYLLYDQIWDKVKWRSD